MVYVGNVESLDMLKMMNEKRTDISLYSDLADVLNELRSLGTRQKKTTFHIYIQKMAMFNINTIETGVKPFQNINCIEHQHLSVPIAQ